MLNILDFIPTGSSNAISRRRLRQITGLSDRKMRDLIHFARRKMPIINLSNGEGYYIPDIEKKEDCMALRRFVKQEESRLKSIGWSLKAARKLLKKCKW